MAIVQLDSFYANQAYQLWDKLLHTHSCHYKPIHKDQFLTKFLPQDQIHSWVYLEDDIVIGFISVVTVKERIKAYLSMIMVDPKHQRQGIGSKLLDYAEHFIKGCNLYPSLDLVFFNPVQFEWIIPNTNQHDHPNAPGVEINSPAYHFFIKQGYQVFAKQNSYYKLIKDYTFSSSIRLLIDELHKHKITITFYDADKHHGFNDLFDDLKNPYWKEEILKAVMYHEPVLIAEKEGLMLGFTGPLRVQSSLRGYFAGIGVHSKTRGLGIGKVLFASLCMELKTLGAHYMTLFTGETNPARKIYENEGFTIVCSWANMRKEF